MAQDFIPVTNAANLDFLAVDYFTPGLSIIPDEVRNDKVLAYSVQPVKENAAGSPTLYTADYLSSDTFSVALGEPDEPPTGGTVALEVGSTTTGLDAIAYNITAAALETALNAALTTEAESLCAVTLLEAGSYEINAVTDGAIASGFFSVANAALLRPTSNAFFAEGNLGSATSKYQVMLIMRQAPVAYSEPTVELPAADVGVATTVTGSATANKIQEISYTLAQTYAGSFTLSAVANAVTATCGVINFGMTIAEVGAVLNQHPQISYNAYDGTANNVTITNSDNGYFIEFIGTLGLSNSPAVSVANIDLVGPQGKSGTINFNTFELYKKSLETDAEQFTLKFSIQRQRVSGEVRTLLWVDMTIDKDIIDVSTAVPVPLPSYYTAAQTDALLDEKIEGPASATDNAIVLFDGTTGKLASDGPLPTTVGTNLITLTNPGAIRFLRIDAGNTVTALSAAAFALAITTPVVLTGDDAITVQDSVVFLEKTSIGAYTIAAPSSQDGTRICIIANTDFAHVVTFTGTTLLDGTSGANLTATFAAFKGASITIVARGAFWLVESLNEVTPAP